MPEYWSVQYDSEVIGWMAWQSFNDLKKAQEHLLELRQKHPTWQWRLVHFQGTVIEGEGAIQIGVSATQIQSDHDQFVQAWAELGKVLMAAAKERLPALLRVANQIQKVAYPPLVIQHHPSSGLTEADKENLRQAMEQLIHRPAQLVVSPPMKLEKSWAPTEFSPKTSSWYWSDLEHCWWVKEDYLADLDRRKEAAVDHQDWDMAVVYSDEIRKVRGSPPISKNSYSEEVSQDSPVEVANPESLGNGLPLPGSPWLENVQPPEEFQFEYERPSEPDPPPQEEPQQETWRDRPPLL